MTKYKKTPEKFRKAGEETHGKGKHKAHRVGERISFKTPKGRTSGKIVAVHKEFYTVVNKNTEYKVNRNSILYLMGTKKIIDVNGQQVNTGPTANSIPRYHVPYRKPVIGRPSVTTGGFTYTPTGPYETTVTDPNGRVIGVQVHEPPYSGTSTLPQRPIITHGKHIPIKMIHQPPKLGPIWNDVKNLPRNITGKGLRRQ